ncbi:hypothetical protein EUTSA_v10011025mg [Eutrema salsugineum]|uniref:Uncharacterized protein n=1 Tax=Eutrema salsugineum TaxID=72664 RepID=V4L4K7_EUTSA|nr:hypothetical protein EUTSA_v10011025mg [Eutrema salsugineum]
MRTIWPILIWKILQFTVDASSLLFVFFRLQYDCFILYLIFGQHVTVYIHLRTNSSSVSSILRKLVAQATIFHLWKQRNNVLHNQHHIPPAIIFKALDRDIRNICSSLVSVARLTSLILEFCIHAIK